MSRIRALGRLICTTKSTLCANLHHYPRLSVAFVPTTRVFDINHSKPGPLPWNAHFHAHAAYMKKHADTSTGPIKGIQDPVRANLSDEERRRMLKLVDTEDLKKRLRATGQDCIAYADAINILQEMRIGTNAEADAMLRGLDNAGIVLILRNMVFVWPDKVAELIAKALPISLVGDNDPRREELRKLEKEKEEIDKAAQKQARRMLWTGFGVLSLQSLLFFRLTFWDLSWDVMEPITFFVTSSAVLAGLLFFIFTRREPSYQDLTHTLFSIKQEKLMKKNKFDAERLRQLQMMHCSLPPPHHHH